MSDELKIEKSAAALKTRHTLMRALLAERVLYAACMGAGSLLPAFLLSRELDEVYFGSISTAGAVTAIFCILTLQLGVTKFKLGYLSVVSGLLLIVGFLMFAVGSQWPDRLVVIGFLAFPLLSAGWVIHFTLGSIRALAITADSDRQQFYMIYASCSTAGICLGPLIGDVVVRLGGSYELVFTVLAIIAVAGTLITISTLKLDTNPNTPSKNDGISTLNLLAKLMQQPAMFFVVVVFFQSSLFTTIFNFQIVFSNQSGLNISVFFICWAAGMIGPRIILRDWLARQSNQIILPSLLALLVCCFLAFALGPQNSFQYGLVTFFAGAFYGLSYSIVQADTVKFTDDASRQSVLVAFSLSYHISFYATPFVAALLISQSGYNVLFTMLACLSLTLAVASFVFYRRS